LTFIDILEKPPAFMLDKNKAQLTVVAKNMEAECYFKLFVNVWKILESYILKDSNFLNFSCWFLIRDLLLRIYAIN